jgi:hypothetical protein
LNVQQKAHQQNKQHSILQSFNTPATMAPNLKNFSLLSESLVSIKLIHPKLAAAPAQRREAPIDTASYWDWEAPACEDVETCTANVLSTFHMEANLRAAAAVQSECGIIIQTNPESDSYWADEQDSAQEEEEPSADYWNDAAQVQPETDDYWNMPTTATVEPVNKQSRRIVSDSYWNDTTHANKTSSSDAYWNMHTNHMAEEPSDASCSPYYWQWSQHAKTTSDAYWS